jgi:hypothetical protein
MGAFDERDVAGSRLFGVGSGKLEHSSVISMP